MLFVSNSGLKTTTVPTLQPCSACEHSELQFTAFDAGWQVVCTRCKNWASLSWSNDVGTAFHEAANSWNKQQALRF